jgi:hypothetical protein
MKTNESKASIRLFFLKTQLFKTQGEKKIYTRFKSLVQPSKNKFISETYIKKL